MTENKKIDVGSDNTMLRSSAVGPVQGWPQGHEFAKKLGLKWQDEFEEWETEPASKRKKFAVREEEICLERDRLR